MRGNGCHEVVQQEMTRQGHPRKHLHQEESDLESPKPINFRKNVVELHFAVCQEATGGNTKVRQRTDKSKRNIHQHSVNHYNYSPICLSMFTAANFSKLFLLNLAQDFV